MDMGDKSDSSTSKSFSLTQGQSPSLSPEPQPVEVPQTSTKEAPRAAENKFTMGPPQVPPRLCRKLTSAVWNHFEKVIVNGEEKAQCVHCRRYYSAKGKNGTSHLKDHIELRCSRKYSTQVDLRQKLLSINRKQNSTSQLENHVFSQEVSRKELANMVILHEYPLSIVDHIGFRGFINSLNPSFKITSRNTLKNDIIKMFGSEKASLKKLFDDHVGRVAITSDMWTTSNQKKGYMVVTSHFIDDHWILRNKTLSHDGVSSGKRKAGSDSLDSGDEGDTWTQIKKNKKKKVNVRCELDHYLEDDALPESSVFDVLHYWKIDLKYPTLRKIAKDILGIPASTVASESAFSMGGRVVSPHRLRLHADTVEALMCMQNWIHGQYAESSLENAHACATILEDFDVEGDGSSSSVVLDANSDGEDF